MSAKIIYALIIITLLSACGNFERQIYDVVSQDEVVETQLFCMTLIGIPVFCLVKEQRTITIKVETIVTEIVETIVEEEVIKEIIIEKIVTEIVTIYIHTETNINEVVSQVVERVKELVPEEEIIDVPIEDIVEEVTKVFIDETTSIVNTQQP